MSSRVESIAYTLALLLCALAACKPAAPPSPATSSDAADASEAATAPTSESTASRLADAAADLNPLASPKDEITTAIKKFVAVNSYHANMQMSGGARGTLTNEIDFVAPDRYRMKMPMGTQHIIGDTMYMQMDGRVMKVPMPKGTLSQWRDPAKLAENEATMTVEAQGSDTIDGMSARKYLVHNTKPQPSDVTIWVGDEGLPVQIQVSNEVQGQTAQTTIRYSRYNDPTLKIDPPQ